MMETNEDEDGDEEVPSDLEALEVVGACQATIGGQTPVAPADPASPAAPAPAVAASIREKGVRLPAPAASRVEEVRSADDETRNAEEDRVPQKMKLEYVGVF
eukprot:Skav208221  [mRNA]  locus=scaffold3686:69928:72709:- [translate_table: standard]